MKIFCYVDKDAKRSQKNLTSFQQELGKHYPVEFIIEEFDASEAEWVERNDKKYLSDKYVLFQSAKVWIKHRNDVDFVHFFIDDDNWQNGDKKLLGFKLGIMHYGYRVMATKLRYKYEDTAEHETLHAIDEYIFQYTNKRLEDLFGVKDFDNDIVHGEQYWKKDYYYDEVWSKLEPLLDEAVRAKRGEKEPPAQTEIGKSESIQEPYRPTNFILQELVSQKIYNEYGERAWQFFDERLLRNLQWVRDNLGITYVNNWHRGGDLQYRGFDACEYRKDGTSQHNHGRGIDFTVKGKTAQQVNDWIKNNHKTAPEPNMWIEGTLNGKPISHNHLDVRFSDIQGVYEFDA